MRDPRLAEIDFLSDLEQAKQLRATCTGRNYDTGITRGDGTPLTRYGFDPDRFLAMMIDLISRGLVVGFFPVTVTQPDENQRRNAAVFEAERNNMTSALLSQQETVVHMSHAGRVHLWNLRDALLRDPDLEPFGLRNRAAWDRDLFVRLRFASADSPLSVMFLDLDNFGAVNKTLGATIGDAVLRVVFGLIKNIVGTRGAAYRYGGEEVGVLLPGVSQVDAGRLAEEIRGTIERETSVQVPQLTGPQTASIGVMAFSAPAENDEIVGKADVLMRAAKKNGKNRVETASGH